MAERQNVFDVVARFSEWNAFDPDIDRHACTVLYPAVDAMFSGIVRGDRKGTLPVESLHQPGQMRTTQGDVRAGIVE